MPKRYEEPISLLKVIASYLQKEEGSHRTQEKKLIEARENATEKLLNKRQAQLVWRDESPPDKTPGICDDQWERSPRTP